MKKIKENILGLSFLLSIPLINISYKLLNNADRGVYSLLTDIDRAVPFLKIFILPYIFWYIYVLGGLVYLCFKNKKVYYIALASLNIGLIICSVLYYYFQTTVLRPELVDNDILTRLVTFIYNHDQPYNCFPSTHVTTTYIVMKGINAIKIYKSFKLLTNIIGILIILSTQFVKQHVILDLIFAILLGEIVYKIVEFLSNDGGVILKKKIISLLTMKKKLEN
ncbi:phosphatase PAP2 family protein [Abyssisolibacter fermentans]|uniref:phosphatase PAP2 family protein n=1 Tax=Abyssisolibacter fermentans TaxID=1766203 RepID=UPI00082B06CC|nr:phosphatase PAP2 family protein [Abyssisolibacter fermentans]